MAFKPLLTHGNVVAFAPLNDKKLLVHWKPQNNKVNADSKRCFFANNSANLLLPHSQQRHKSQLTLLYHHMKNRHCHWRRFSLVTFINVRLWKQLHASYSQSITAGSFTFAVLQVSCENKSTTTRTTQFMVRTEERSVLYLYTKFEADSSIRSKIIRVPKCGN